MKRNNKAVPAVKLASKKVKQAQAKSSSRSLPSVAASISYASGQSVGQASVFRNSVDSCRIRHRELIGSVSGSTAYANASTFALNPGLSATFPWLSVQAQGWEMYEFHRVRLCYYTRTATTTGGSMILAVDYDAADDPPLDEATISTYYGTQEDSPWKDICLDLDRSRLSPKRYIRNGPLAANLDIKTYDVGNLFAATVDGVDGTPWGKLWIEYDVTFFNPQLPSGGPLMSTALFRTTPTSQSGILDNFESNGFHSLSGSGNIIFMHGLVVGKKYMLSAGISGAQTMTSFYVSGVTGVTLMSNIGTVPATTVGSAGLICTFIPNVSDAQISLAAPAYSAGLTPRLYGAIQLLPDSPSPPF